MCACQWKWGFVVIEDSTSPSDGGVAGRAGGGKSSGGVIGSGGSCEVFGVAGKAISGECGEVVLNMAERALGGGVSACQREDGLGVIEGRWTPADGGVTNGAVGGEA